MSKLKKKSKRGPKRKDGDLSLLSLAWELGYIIAIPIVVLAIGGAFLDEKMGTSPWMLLVGVTFSILITSFMVYLKVARLMTNLSDDE